MPPPRQLRNWLKGAGVQIARSETSWGISLKSRSGRSASVKRLQHLLPEHSLEQAPGKISQGSCVASRYPFKALISLYNYIFFREPFRSIELPCRFPVFRRRGRWARRNYVSQGGGRHYLAPTWALRERGASLLQLSLSYGTFLLP